jgi:hypothetical protein
MNHNKFYRYPSEYIVKFQLIKRVGQAFYISGNLSHYDSQSLYYIVNSTVKEINIMLYFSI